MKKKESTLIERITGLLRHEKFRYLLAGGVNTAFGYLSFTLMLYLFYPPIHYMIIMVFSTVVNVTFSFLTYKLFVFKTKSNYLKEYLRFYMVYAIPIGLGFIAFPFCIEVLRLNPYVAQALIMVVTVIISYIGHKRVTFKKPPSQV